MKKIISKEDKKFFKSEIKKQLKDILSNVEDNLNDNLAFELWNTDDTIICRIFAKEGMTTPDFDRDAFPSIKVDNFMYGNGFNLNKNTSDYQLNKVVKRIINEYNDIFDKEIEYRKASEEFEAEWGK